MKVNVDFFYEGKKYSVSCSSEDKLNTMFDKFIKILNNESQIEEYSFFFNDEEFKEEENNKTIGRNSLIGGKNKIIISVQKKLKIIKCPKCNYNDSIIDLKNYQAAFSGCEHNHSINFNYNIYQNCQKIIPSDIKCCEPNCKHNQENDKSEFYFCLTCSKMIKRSIIYDKSCKLAHDKNHVCVNFYEKNYFCKSHFKKFIKYCFNCKKNICEQCENDHQNHEIKNYEFMAPNEGELKELKDSLKKIGDAIKNLKLVIDDLIYSLNGTLRLFQNYYDIANDIIYKYEHFNKNEDKKKELLNFAILKSLRNLKYSNKNISKDIESLLTQNNKINTATSILYINQNRKAMYKGDENKDSKKDYENDNDKEWLNMIKENEEKEKKKKKKK